MYHSITTAIQEILNKDIKTIKKDIEENDTVAGDIQIVDKPLLKKKKTDDEVPSNVLRRQPLENSKKWFTRRKLFGII